MSKVVVIVSFLVSKTTLLSFGLLKQKPNLRKAQPEPDTVPGDWQYLIPAPITPHASQASIFNPPDHMSTALMHHADFLTAWLQ